MSWKRPHSPLIATQNFVNTVSKEHSSILRRYDRFMDRTDSSVDVCKLWHSSPFFCTSGSLRIAEPGSQINKWMPRKVVWQFRLDRDGLAVTGAAQTSVCSSCLLYRTT